MPNRAKRESSPHREQAAALADSVRLARKMAKLSQESLAHQSGLSLNTLRNIEGGRTVEPGVFTIVAVAAALKIPVCDLLGDLGGGALTLERHGHPPMS